MRTAERRNSSRGGRAARILALVALLVSSVAVARVADAEEPAPTIVSDRADYAPGATVTLTGSGWGGDTSVHISVNDTLGKSWNREVDVPVDGDGRIIDSFVLPSTFVAQYDVTATGLETGRIALTTFTDAAADLDQCANGGVGDPPESCNDAFPSNWVNGNLGASKSHYLEGDSVPYRIKMSGLVAGSAGNTLTFAWDVTKDGKHALDYLTDFDRTVTDANPCTGVAGCNPVSETTFPIPQDPTVPFPQVPGSFSMFGGAITSVSAYGANPGADTCPAGNPDFVGTDTRCITITFTAGATNPVLAWGGHIASRANWGAGNAAVNIAGSPFHTSFVALNGSGGNQDRSLSNDAVIFPATIRIIKHADPAGPTQFDFTGSPLPVTNFSLTDNDGGTDPSQVFTMDAPAEFTTYTIDEAVAANFATTSIVCQVTDPNGGSATTDVPNGSVQIDLREGENRTCTFTNTLQTGTLTVVKHVVNDDGGSAGAGDWSIHVRDGGVEVVGSPQPGSEAGTVYSLVAGTYDVSETGGPSGYSFDGFTGGCNLSGQVTVLVGQNVTCTLTNDDDVATLKLVKVVDNNDGGTATPDSFTLFADADAPDDGRNFSNAGGSGVFEDVFAGVVYDLSETGPSGYTAGSWVCTGGGTQVGSTIELGLGEDVTCTLTNTDDLPRLKLVKVVDANDGGAAGPADFELAANGSSRSFTSQTATPAFHDVTAGVVYTLSESGPNGYSASAWNCDGGAQVGATIQLSLGQQVTCTITNTDDTPRLKLVKVVDADDGGVAGADDFTLSADADAPDDGRNFSNAGGSGVFEDVFSGVVYDLSESGPAGYSASAWSCDGGTQVGATVELGLGEDVTCTITNTDDTPRLKLVKVVDNNDGGTGLADDWTLAAAAPAPDDGRNFSNAGGSGVFEDVFAGTTYVLSESGPPGYTASSWSCDGGLQLGAMLTVDLGEQVTCTITNTDDTPSLTLVKSVVNDDGGTEGPGDWTLSATAAAPDAGRNFSGAGDSGIAHDVFAGAAYDLAEAPDPGAGYSSTGQWSCPGGTMSNNNTTVTVDLGEDVTCTIINTDDTPRLKLVKLVSGGSATPDGFTLSADADAPDDGRNFSNAGGSGVFEDVFAGVVYDLSESGPLGYTASSWSCTGGGSQVGATIELDLGEQVTCTITNTRDLGSIQAVKYHDLNGDGDHESGGDPTLSGWTMFVDLDKNGVVNAGEPTGVTNGSGAVTFPGLETNVGGSTYWVCEVPQATWVNSDPGGASVSVTGPCEATTVTKDATSTVRFGNFQRIGVQVNKTVDGGSVPNGITFPFSIRTGASPDPGGLNGGFGTVVANGSVTGPDGTIAAGEWAAAAGQQYPLDPGTYQLCEAIVLNYTPSWVQGVYGVDWFSPGIQSGAGFQENENTLVCITFTVVSGDGGADLTVEFGVDNAPRGMSRTIGFWKNWTSCDGSGKQFPMLDLMISGGTYGGVTYAGADDSNGNGLRDIRIGDLFIEGPNACKIAVDLLDKRPVGDPSKVRDKAKAAGDAVYNSVAQLVAFELNQLLNPVYSGSASCQTKAASAARLMQRFLMYVDFRMQGNNSAYTLPELKARARQIGPNLLYLANIVDDYNNNTIAGCANAIALPKPTVAGTSPSQTWAAFLPAATDT